MQQLQLELINQDMHCMHACTYVIKRARWNYN
jgi:hypothetical protein